MRAARGAQPIAGPCCLHPDPHPLHLPALPALPCPALPCLALDAWLQPLLENLLAEFTERYPGVAFPPLPRKGELDLNVLREATYFFS